MNIIPVEDEYPLLGMICPSCGGEITCGFLECPLCEARSFYESAGPPRSNMLSEPESRKRLDEARPKSDAKKLCKHLDRWDSSDATEEGRAWRQERADGGCCRLKNTPVTPKWTSGSARQIPPGPIKLFNNGWILHFLCTAREGSDPEAPEGIEARIRATHARAPSRTPSRRSPMEWPGAPWTHP